MNITLEMIDQVRSRTGVSYKEARDALERANGDVVQALIALEEKDKQPGQTWTERIQVQGSEVVDRIKELIREGNVTRIVVKQGDNVIVELPVTVGAVGAVIAPFLAAFGVAVALASKCTIELERKGPMPGGDGGPVTNARDVDK